MTNFKNYRTQHNYKTTHTISIKLIQKHVSYQKKEFDIS